jgi:hypothetical protein
MGKTLRAPVRRTLMPRASRSEVHAIDPHPEDALACTDPSFVLAVSHAPWQPARVQNMVRMRETLRAAENTTSYREVTDRLPNWQWAERMWQWADGAAIATGASHAVFLQDDLDLHPQFWKVLRAMVGAAHNKAIALIANHPYGRRAVDRKDSWYLTSECLGSGYVLPACMLHAFVAWRAAQPIWRIRSTGEDYLITCWLNRTGRRAWHPVPSPIDHRRDIASTNPRDRYPFRRSYVRWDATAVAGRDLTSVATWQQAQPPLDLGFDATGVHAEFPLGRDPVRPPSYTEPGVLQEHDRICRAESAGIRY